jgi:hypothetical protein
MMARLLGVVAEVLIGLLIAGVVVGAVVPFAHQTVGPVGAALIGIASVATVIAVGEFLRRRKPMTP